MKIIAHRGLWNSEHERNSLEALKQAFSMSLSTETDVRDHLGEIIVSHDLPSEPHQYLKLTDLITVFKTFNLSECLVLNIKSDGLSKKLEKIFKYCEFEDYLLFDMSVPDMVQVQKHGLKFLTRMSEFEREPVMVDKAHGIWLDDFGGEYISEISVNRAISYGKPVYIVSSELHGRCNKMQWNIIKKFASEDIILCTDFPSEALTFFGV